MENIKITELLKLDLPFVLASKSPRRNLLLKQLGLDFQIIPSQVKETKFHNEELVPEEYVSLLAEKKAIYVARVLEYPAVVFGADTIVVLENQIINKPKSEDAAFEMLNNLSGKTHYVFTGMCFINTLKKKKVNTFQKTAVTFRKLEDDEIRAYIATGSPFDKAGGYGIQDDFGSVFVSHIEGCYYNIVGLPLELFYRTLREFLR